MIDVLQQGPSWKGTAQSLDDYMRKQSSQYRVAKRGIAYWVNDIYPAGARQREAENLRQDVSHINAATKRFEAEKAIEGRPSMPILGGKNPMTPFKRDLKVAMMIGDVDRANQLMEEWFNAVPAGDYEEQMNSLQQSMRNSRPIKVGSSTSRAMAENFMEWLEPRNPVLAETTKRIDENYMNTGIAIGLFAEPKLRNPMILLEERAKALDKHQIRSRMRQRVGP